MEAARSVTIPRTACSQLPKTGLPTISGRPLRFSTLRLCLSTPSGEGVSSSSSGDRFSEWSNKVQSKKCLAVEEGLRMIGKMLSGVEPLDTSMICKGVSEAAADYMKRTVSRILGALSSLDFSVSFKASFHPFHRLLVSAIVTGYTIWNAEYRMSLSRNLCFTEEGCELNEGGAMEEETCINETYPETSAEVPRNLSPEAIDYIESLHLKIANTKEELDRQRREEAEKKRNDQGKRNDLMRYIRTVGPLMVTNIARPSSIQVEDIIHQLVQSILHKISKAKTTSNFVGNIACEVEDRACDIMGTSREYLSKLLYWCMLLGHHLRGLENGLELSCAV